MVALKHYMMNFEKKRKELKPFNVDCVTLPLLFAPHLMKFCFYYHGIARALYCCAELQARGLKKHLKRLNAPKHWMLDKLGGAFAPKPSSGPHKSRECLPLILILRNRLKYALTYREVIAILMQRHVLVDGKVRTDKTYPAGFMGKHSPCYFSFWSLIWYA